MILTRFKSLILSFYPVYRSLSNKHAILGLYLFILACLFNPILQFYIKRETWIFLDIIVILVFITNRTSIIILKENI